MKKIKETNSIFYPQQAEKLLELLNSFNISTPAYYSRAVIVPHAGYIYSGELAYEGINRIDKNAKNVFIFAPSHHERIYGCVTCDYDVFQTPIGEIEVNKELSKEIKEFCDCDINNYAFDREHSIEVQLPMIKKLLPNAKIVPVLYGCENFDNLAKTIEKFWWNKENVFIISSDLSHFYPEKEACKIDFYTAKQIEGNDIRNFDIDQACGAVGICGIVEFAKQKNYSLIRIGITNSSKTNGDSSSVVGYGSWFLYEGDKNSYIKKYYSDLVLKICKDSILSGLQLGEVEFKNYPCVLEEQGASFVTLEHEGILRGCIGTIHPYKPLIQDLIKNAHAAAFSDLRFPALTIDEYNKIKIKVSLLSKPIRIHFDNENELLEKLTLKVDGLIIRDGLKQAVFLPEVWEQLPDKKEFLEQLKIKAELDRNYYSESLEAFKFQTTKILNIHSS